MKVGLVKVVDSRELAEIFLGGNDEEMIEDAYSRCIDSLEFRIKPMPAEK